MSNEFEPTAPSLLALEKRDNAYALAAAKQQRIEEGIAKTLQRSIEINMHLRTALQKAAERFEAKGMHSDAHECRRVLRDV